MSDTILKDRAYEIAGNRNYDGYEGALTSMVYNLAEELHKPVIKKSKKRKAYARFKDNIWAPDLAEMKSLSSENKIVRYLLYAIDVLTNYAYVKPLKDEKGKTIVNALIEIVNESNSKLNKLLG